MATKKKAAPKKVAPKVAVSDEFEQGEQGEYGEPVQYMVNSTMYMTGLDVYHKGAILPAEALPEDAETLERFLAEGALIVAVEAFEGEEPELVEESAPAITLAPTLTELEKPNGEGEESDDGEDGDEVEGDAASGGESPDGASANGAGQGVEGEGGEGNGAGSAGE